ncbi:MAG: transglutaminase domain-containing protein, partial [Burkholderiaceae bacterium]|nr:transglutaminase domain-containing protein [Burkholderiaceae bacterium]
LTLVAVLGLLATMVTMQFGGRELSIARRFRAAANLMVQAVPIAALFFLLFPRLDGPLWGMPEDAHASRTGLSESMSPGQISRLGHSDEVAFRVKFDGAVPAPATMYWRGPSFVRYDGQTWTAPVRAALAQPAPQVEPDASSLVAYTVTLEPTNRNWLFALEAPVRVEVPSSGAALMPDLQLVARERLSDRLRYRIESATAFRFGLGEPAGTLREARELPEGFNPKTLEMAARWRAQDDDPQRLVERALQFFVRERFSYTLTPPLLGRDGVDEFLFDTRAGFCEHFAGAFVVLMRAMGVAARVVTGYQGGEQNPVDGFWVVRQADAHAWAEVWIAQRGWVRIDPTSVIAPERIEFGSRRLRESARDALSGLELANWSSLRFRLDALANAWNQWILSYDHTRQRKLFSSLGLGLDDWRDLVGALTAGLALLLAGVALITLHQGRPREPVDRCYDEFCKRMSGAGVERAPHETAGHLLSKAERVLDPARMRDARRIVTLYNRLRYGATPANRSESVRHLRTLVNAFKP